MNSISTLHTLLSPLRLYALGQGGLIDSEIHAYSTAFDVLWAKITVLREMPHPQLATGVALDLHEDSVGLPVRSELQDDERRDLILRRLSRPYSSCRAGTEEALESCGLIGAQIEERPGGLFITAQAIAPGVRADQAWQLALLALPAHLPAFIAGNNWDELDAVGKKWDELDYLGRSWVELALIGIG